MIRYVKFTFVILMFLLFTINGNGQSWSKLGIATDTIIIGASVYDTTNHVYYLSGYLSSFNGQQVNNIISWDGTTWNTLGSRFNGSIEAMIIYNGSLIVGGNFDSSGTQKFNAPLAKWNGSIWMPLDNNFACHNPLDPLLLPIIESFANFNNSLYFAGNFVSNTNSFLGDLGIWDGLSIQNPLNFSSFIPDHKSLVVFKNNLYIKTNSSVDTCAIRNVNYNYVYGLLKLDTVCRTFTTVGIWPQPTNIYSLYSTDSLLYIGYDRPTAYGNFITSYDGSNFYPLGQGLNNNVFCISDYQGSIVAGGMFTGDFNGSVSMQYIGKWNGNSWIAFQSNCQLNGWMYNINHLDTFLIVNGAFISCGSDTTIHYSAIYPSNITTGLNSHLPDIKEHFNVFYSFLDHTITIINNSDFLEVRNLEIYSVIGTLIKNKVELLNNIIKLNTENFSKGVYIIKIELGNNKFVISKIVIY